MYRHWDGLLNTHILPSDRRPSRPLQAQQSLPAINLTGLEDINQRLKIVSQIAEASQEWGFFQSWIGLMPLFITFFQSGTKQLSTGPKYPPHTDLVNGLRPHSDGDTLIVLLDDGVDDLQVRKDEQWYTMASVPGALIVNIGDFLQIVSNGKYESAEHRAMVNTDQNRMSIIMFLLPQPDVLIGDASELIDENHPRMYQTTKVEDYGTIYMSQDIQGKDILNALLVDQAGDSK